MRLFKGSLILVTGLSAILFLSTVPASAKAVEIRAAAFETPGPATKGFEWFMKKVNEAGKDIVQIKFMGGPESIPARDQAEAARRGSVDFILVPTSYYMNLVPEGMSLAFSPLTPSEERSTGYHSFLVEKHKAAGLHFIGRENWGTLFNTWTNKKVAHPRELARQMLRVGKSPTPFVKALGAEPVSLPISDIYSAVDRGIVDGFMLPAEFVVENRLYEVVKYGIKPGFWNRDEVFLMNLGTWQKLPKAAQDVISKAQLELEADMVKASENLLENSFKKCEANGLKVIAFTGEDAKWYLDKASNVAWETMKTKLKPEDFKALQKMFSK